MEFDFDGEAGESTGTGTKREFADLDDDEEELYPSKKIYASHGPSSDHATTTILNLRSSLEDRDKTIAELKASLEASKGELEKWTSGFTNENSLLPSGVTPEPAVVVQALQKLQAAESQLKEQLLNAKRREGVIVVKLATTEQEVVDLKSTVHDLKLLSKPSMQQTRRLLLDPAIHAEFTRMKKELEAAEKRVKELQDDLAAVQFTPHSKHGKLLMAKCRTLQEENTEIGREASEGKVHELGTRLAVQKSINAELRRCYTELYETVEEANYELERSQQTVYNLQRELQKSNYRLAEIQKQMDEQSRREEPTPITEEQDQPLEEKDADKSIDTGTDIAFETSAPSKLSRSQHSALDA